MRMTTEACDHVAMSAGLRCGELQQPAKRLWRLFHELLCELDRQLLVREILRVPKAAHRMLA
jgi:hypothetical protein